MGTFSTASRLTQIAGQRHFAHDRDTQLPHRGLVAEMRDEFINQKDFSSFQATLHAISSTSVKFVDGNGAEVDVENLSDGYRSILSMTFELIRQMAAAYGPKGVFDPDDSTKVIAPGVVLIDEIDAHLYPTWQRRVGVWFREHFPKVQFIVTTHCPIICQAADPGSLFRLPRPGTEEKGGFIWGDELKRLLYGSILDAYGTEVFGDGITRSEKSLELLNELAALNVKQFREGLAAEDKRRHRELRATLPTTAYTTANGTYDNSSSQGAAQPTREKSRLNDQPPVLHPATDTPTQAADPRATLQDTEVRTRAERILKGDSCPDDYLPVPDKLVDEVSAHYQRVAEESGVIATEEARRKTLMDWPLLYHFGGLLVLRRRTDQGVIVLAVGDEEVGAVSEAFKVDARSGFGREVPFEG